MASKRMSISALLSTDASASSSKPPSPAPASAARAAPEDGEPPHKRQRHAHAHAYTQQYYESYNAYPYAHGPATATAAAAAHRSVVTPPTYPPQWEDSRRHVPAAAAFDFAGPRREAGASAAVHEVVTRDELDEWRLQQQRTSASPASAGAGESLASVLTGQMRARQMGAGAVSGAASAAASGAVSGTAPGTAPGGLPAPPQLRRESQYHSYSPPPMRPRDLSPPSTTPVAPCAPRFPSPFLQHSEPPATATRTQAGFARQSAPHYSRPSVSPTHGYPAHAPSYAPHTIGNFPPPPAAPSPTHQYSPISPGLQPVVPSAHVSHASPGTSPTASYIPPPRTPAEMASSALLPQPRLRLPPASRPRVLQLQPSSEKEEAVEDHSFEDELLSLVDGDTKPQAATTAATATATTAPTPSPLGRKTSSSSTPKVRCRALRTHTTDHARAGQVESTAQVACAQVQESCGDRCAPRFRGEHPCSGLLDAAAVASPASQPANEAVARCCTREGQDHWRGQPEKGRRRAPLAFAHHPSRTNARTGNGGPAGRPPLLSVQEAI